MTTFSQPLPAVGARFGRLALVLALFALLLAPLGLLADKAVVPLVLVTAGAGGLLAGRTALPWRIIDRNLVLAVVLLSAWCLLAALWSFHPLEAATLALRVALLLMVLLYLAALVQLLADKERHRVAEALGLGFGIALAMIGIELIFDGPILTLLQGAAPSDYATDSRLNRGISAVSILVWPLAVFAWARGSRSLAFALPALVFAVTLFSQSSASMLALGAGLLAALLAASGRQAARAVMALAVIVTLFGSPLVPSLAQQTGLAQAEFLPDTARYRLHIWMVVSGRIAERPLLGWGFDASPDLPVEGVQPFRPGGKVIPSHPHNGALQILVETGLVGSLLTLALLFLVGRRIDRLAPVPRACAVATLVTVLGIAATAYGIWQSHWLAMIGAAAAVFIAVLPAPKSGR
ncbi:MAG: O-antigen ligase family protein [Kiloniellaceae bacterium]